MATKGREPRVCVGEIVGVHGVRGLVRLRAFTADPQSVIAYGAPWDEAGGRQFRIALTGTVKGMFLARIDGIADRTAAEALSGTRLYVDRAALPEPEPEEFYHADLIGLSVERIDGARFGRVSAVHDFGAGDVLEIRGVDGGSVFLPFTRAVVPAVDVKGGRIVVDPPDEVEVKGDVSDAEASVEVAAEEVEGER